MAQYNMLMLFTLDVFNDAVNSPVNTASNDFAYLLISKQRMIK